MRKRDELTKPTSCMSRASDDEMTFVLLGRDKAATVAIRAWIAERIRLGKNQPGDAQIVEAEQCARTMEAESCQAREATRAAIVCPVCGSGNTSVRVEPTPAHCRCFKCGNAWREGAD